MDINNITIEEVLSYNATRVTKSNIDDNFKKYLGERITRTNLVRLIRVQTDSYIEYRMYAIPEKFANMNFPKEISTEWGKEKQRLKVSVRRVILKVDSTEETEDQRNSRIKSIQHVFTDSFDNETIIL